MNTEPPTGDDLQRLLVSMKQNVLERTAEPRPQRRGRHVGLIVGLVALVALGTTSGAVAVGLVPSPLALGPASTPSPTSVISPTTPPPTSAPSTSPSSSTPSGGTSSASIPTACTASVPTGDYARLFGTTPLQQLRPVASGATSKAIPVPAGASFFERATLVCAWRDPDADVSGLGTETGSADVSTLAAYQADLAEQGYTCSAHDGGTSCQLVRPNPEYPVDDTHTFFVRDSTWIEITQTNFPTTNLLGALVSQIWRS